MPNGRRGWWRCWRRTPFAVFYGAVYTESISPCARRPRSITSGAGIDVRTAAFALLCGFARPNGFLLAVPIALAALWPALVAARRDAGSASLGTRLFQAVRA